MIKYILLAEFDINCGGIVRLQYPHEIPNADKEEIGNYMLPEGSHNRRMDVTFFMLNRSPVNNERLSPSKRLLVGRKKSSYMPIELLEDKNVPVLLFIESNSKWVELTSFPPSDSQPESSRSKLSTEEKNANPAQQQQNKSNSFNLKVTQKSKEEGKGEKEHKKTCKIQIFSRGGEIVLGELGEDGKFLESESQTSSLQ